VLSVVEIFPEPSGNRNNDNPMDENNRIGFRARNLTTDGTESTDKKGQADITSFSYPCPQCYPWLKFFPEPSGNRNNDNPTDENNNIGFRVSQAPEFAGGVNLRPDLMRVLKARSTVPSSGTTRLSRVPVADGQAKKKARSW
jgi:hypothetical protein